VPTHGESLLGPVRRTDVFADYERPVRTLLKIASPAMDAAAR
jgi:hypothetical protein